MANYFVNREPQDNGDHEVHKESCERVPQMRLFVGNHSNCYDAVREATKSYKQVNGCAICCRNCHTS
jgi:hypothetical protein